MDIYRQPLDPDNMPAGLFDWFDSDAATPPNDGGFGKANLAEEAINLVEEYESFPTLDINEAVRLVEDDFYWVCDRLL